MKVTKAAGKYYVARKNKPLAYFMVLPPKWKTYKPTGDKDAPA